ncbi:MAG: nucleoside triphosphate pyrophosphohydrolase [Gammaproteobacteria bacterium]|jgi:ATP diphosphatase
MQKQYDKGDISKLLDIMAALRDPETGCPWDLEQDFDTIAPYTLEEAYEVADSIERNALEELPDELGDLLLQVVFHAQMGADRDLFGFSDVVESICDKMIRRHPHVFGDASLRTGEEVLASWDQIKRSEKPEQTSLLDGIARALPALVRAGKIGRKAASVGFDWPSAGEVRAKIDEELAELDAAVANESKDRIEAELGDLLFSIANYCRHLEIDAEQALRRANDRFGRRFRRVESQVHEAGGDWDGTALDLLEAYWANAKAAESD